MNRNDIHVFLFYFFVLYSLKVTRRRALTVETKGQGPGAKRKPVALLSLTAKNRKKRGQQQQQQQQTVYTSYGGAWT